VIAGSNQIEVSAVDPTAVAVKHIGDLRAREELLDPLSVRKAAHGRSRVWLW